MATAEGEVRRDMWGQEYRTASANCAAALDAYYVHTMAFGRGRRPAVLRAAAVDPSCVLASALAAPRDPALLAAAAERISKATEYERAVFRALSALVREEKDGEVAIERHFEVLHGLILVADLETGSLLKEFPRDLMSLKGAQLMCFYMGRPDTSLKFVEQYVDAILTIPKGSLFPMCGEENQAFLEEIEKTVALLVFEDVKNCPYGELLDVSQRLKTASKVNAAILTSQSHEKEV